LISQVAADPFHFTYLYWIAVPVGSVTVPDHGTFAPLPWMVSAKPDAGVQLPSAVWLPTTYRFCPTTVFALAIVKVIWQALGSGVVAFNVALLADTLPAAS
jgi:hypothetical protein